MTFVVDASVALSWSIDSDRTPATDALLDHAAGHGAVAPSILMYEIANRLARACRTGELTIDHVREMMHAFTALDLELVEPATMAVVERAAASGLTAYDAAYLEVSVARGIPLATLDQHLREAARAAGVTVWPAPDV